MESPNVPEFLPVTQSSLYTVTAPPEDVHSDCFKDVACDRNELGSVSNDSNMQARDSESDLACVKQKKKAFVGKLNFNLNYLRAPSSEKLSQKLAQWATASAGRDETQT